MPVYFGRKAKFVKCNRDSTMVDLTTLKSYQIFKQEFVPIQTR